MTTSEALPAVQAAGVVLLRRDELGPQTLLVHRPHRQDWTLPKGKVDSGEHIIETAVREADEETGYRVTIGPPLTTLSYLAFGRPKIVHYWSASPSGAEEFLPNDEIDEIAWVPVGEAASRLSYDHDARLVAQAAALPPTTPLIILRHAQAIKRSEFDGKADTERPLSGRGRSQSKALVPLLGAFGITSVQTSDAVRCQRTVRDYAKASGNSLSLQPSLSEEGYASDPRKASKRIRRLVRDPLPTVLCSHRPVLPAILDAAAEAFEAAANGPAWDPKLPPGGFIVMHRAFDGGTVRVVAVERHELVRSER